MVETLDKIISAPAVIYCPAGEPHGMRHGMRNVSDAAARYLVFEFHPADLRAPRFLDVDP